MAAMASSPGTDWTENERAHIGRLETLCRSTEHWEMCSFTDAGDPWCVIYDTPDRSTHCTDRPSLRRCVAVTWAFGEHSDNEDIALAELVSMTC